MDEDAFLAAIGEAPEDDAPRLIFADWLEDRGDPRGELIRVQCERARTDDRDPRCIELEYRERSLLAKYRNAWAKPVRPWARNVEFHRGLVERIAISAATFLERGDDLLSRAPIRQVKLTRVKERIADIAKSPLLARLTHLDLRDGKLGLARLRTLLASRWLGGLTGLDVSFNGLSVSAVRDLVACERIRQVARLGLDSCGMAGEGLEMLLASELAEGVEELQLRSNGLNHEDAARLADSPAMRSLRDLALDFNRELEGEGVRRLLRSEHLVSLRRLSLRECRLGEQMDAFDVAAHCRELVALNLDHNLLGAEGAQRLAKSPLLAGLVELHLELASIKNEGLAALLESGNLRNLRTLRLPHNGLDRAAAEVLAAWEGTQRFTHLDLTANRIGDRGVAAIAKSENLSNLNILDLRLTKLSDRGARALADSPTLNRLTELRLTARREDGPLDWAPGLSAEMKTRLVKRFGKHVCHFD